jgi:ubiquitin carboxyl-terminal hydrolase 36/42
VTGCIEHHLEGEQEDAHEYLVNLLERLHRLDMEAYTKIWELKECFFDNRRLEVTSSIHQIFAGIIASQVTCTRCGSVSNSYDPFTDLSLELNDCFTVTRCLERFTKLETLENSNAYHCDKCDRKCKATKQLLMHTLPNVLILQFKRFSSGGMDGGKVSKHVAFDMQLDMSEFLSRPALGGEDAAIFDLYGVLVHDGQSTNCGHYYSVVKHQDNWIKFDDAICTTMSLSQVLEQKAYLLFYARRVTRQESLAKPPLHSPIISTPQEKLAQAQQKEQERLQNAAKEKDVNAKQAAKEEEEAARRQEEEKLAQAQQKKQARRLQKAAKKMRVKAKKAAKEKEEEEEEEKLAQAKKAEKVKRLEAAKEKEEAAKKREDEKLARAKEAEGAQRLEAAKNLKAEKRKFELPHNTAPGVTKKARQRRVRAVGDRLMSDAQTNTEEQLKASKTAAIQFLDSHASDMTRDDEIPVLLQKSLEWEDVSGTEVPFASHGSR